MPTPRIFVTRRIPDAGLRLLEAHAAVDVFAEERPITHAELFDAVRDIDGLLCTLIDPVDAAVIRSAERLRVISAIAVGYDNIDVAAARERGIAVTNTPGVLTDATADIAFALLVACARRVVESDRWLRENPFPGWAPTMFLGLDLRGRTLGIVGAGRIGRAMARRARGAFDMRILYFSRSRSPEIEAECGATRTQLSDLLAASDFVSIHVPLTPETRHLIDGDALARMKSDAVLVNTARGPVVDERALIEALRARRIFAAGLDVYENEPSIPDELKALENVIILPHIGSASIETRENMARIAAENLLSVLGGREPLYRVA